MQRVSINVVVYLPQVIYFYCAWLTFIIVKYCIGRKFCEAEFVIAFFIRFGENLMFLRDSVCGCDLNRFTFYYNVDRGRFYIQ
ncbi:hypothetical protein D3C84_948780 [compost metagenome]